jgi:hypothetical protein
VATEAVAEEEKGIEEGTWNAVVVKTATKRRKRRDLMVYFFGTVKKKKNYLILDKCHTRRKKCFLKKKIIAFEAK